MAKKSLTEGNPSSIEHRSLLGDFGLFPLTSFYRESPSDSTPHFKFELEMDPKTGLVNLREPFPIDSIRPRHEWLTCFEPEGHLDDLTHRIAEAVKPGRHALIGGFSFKDTSLLRRLADKGHLVHDNVAATYPGFGGVSVSPHAANYALFGFDAMSYSLQTPVRPDVLIVRHLLEHAYDLRSFVLRLRSLVLPSGIMVIEVPDCSKAFSSGDCTLLWEEHVSYFTENSLKRVFAGLDFSISECIRYRYQLEDSLVIFVRADSSSCQSMNTFTSQPDAGELNIISSYPRKVLERASRARSLVAKARNRLGPIAMFGASHLSFTFVSVTQISDLIDCYLDDDPNKQTLFPPIGVSPILSSEDFFQRGIKVCLLGVNPISHSKILARFSSSIRNGAVFASIFPDSEYYFENVLGDILC
ncbi:C-methyltransferase [Burkholderiales bacterium]